MDDISLISKSQKERGIPHGISRKKKGSMSALMKAALVILVFVLLVWGTLFFWQSSLESQAQQLEEERKAVIAERDAALETRVKTLSSLITTYQGLLTQHRNWSRLFDLLEDRTLPSVTFEDFSGVYTTNTFELIGSAPNYLTVAKQIKAFEESEHLLDVSVASVELGEEGDIEFELAIEFKKDVVTGIPTDISIPTPVSVPSATSTQPQP